MFHHGGVLVQERFAFGAIGNDGVGLGGELDVGGEPTTTGTDNPGLTNLVNETHNLERRFYGSGPGDFQTKSRQPSGRPASLETSLRKSLFAAPGSINLRPPCKTTRTPTAK
jgi:hypothetical protein